MTDTHFTDSKPGWFYFDPEASGHSRTSGEPAVLVFAGRNGVAIPLWSLDGASTRELLPSGRLGWPVLRAQVEIPAGSGMPETLLARNYRALVRPDTQQVISVVTTAYAVAENQWVADVVDALSSRAMGRPALIAAASFGRDGERSLFVGRIAERDQRKVCLVAWNTHGGEGAVRFSFVEYDRRGTAIIADVPGQSWSHPHTGRLDERLRVTARHGRRVEEYLEVSGDC